MSKIALYYVSVFFFSLNSFSLSLCFYYPELMSPAPSPSDRLSVFVCCLPADGRGWANMKIKLVVFVLFFHFTNTVNSHISLHAYMVSMPVCCEWQPSRSPQGCQAGTGSPSQPVDRVGWCSQIDSTWLKFLFLFYFCESSNVLTEHWHFQLIITWQGRCLDQGSWVTQGEALPLHSLLYWPL